MSGLRRLLVLVTLAVVGGTGCVNGFVYHHVTVPLDVNFAETPAHQSDSFTRVSRNALQYYVRIEWGSDGTGDIAKKAGLTRVDYADIETLSILGVWTQSYAHVYGER